jgi:hypothetical protein
MGQSRGASPRVSRAGHLNGRATRAGGRKP